MIYGLDPRGYPRIYAGTVKDALEEAARYVRRRPDTGPLDLWEFAEPAPETAETMAGEG